LKAIKSNKKGFHIHSPFVYELVTNVLFNKNININFPETGFLQSARQVQLNILHRLLHHFSPEKVFFSESLTEETEKTILNFPFAVLSESVFCRLTRFPENNSTWFIKKDSRSSVPIFKNLPECENGIIAIELKHSGIIIFDKKFCTQWYEIK